MFHHHLEIKGSGLLLVRLEGDFTDREGMETFKERILETCSGLRFMVVLDFERVRAVDSRGIGLLARILGCCRSNGGHLFVTGAKPALTNVLHMTKLDTLIHVVDSQETALRLIREIRSAPAPAPPPAVAAESAPSPA